MLQYLLKRFTHLQIIITILLSIISLPNFAADLSVLNEGQSAFNQHQYDKAFSIWMSLAQQGNSDAQVFVGLSYKNGWGVNKDLQRSNMWFQMAAESGNSAGQFFLGLHYVNSKDPQTVSTGVQWLVQAAENGDTSAKQFLIKARIRRWFDVPSTLNMKPIVSETIQVTPDNINKVLSINDENASTHETNHQAQKSDDTDGNLMKEDNVMNQAQVEPAEEVIIPQWNQAGVN